MTLRFAVVGCGVIGKLHAEVLAADPDTTVSVLVDVDAAAAEALAQRLDPAPFVTTSVDEALARDDVDAVAICVPSGAHAQVAVAALGAGRHVVVEKPVDVTVEAAAPIAAAAAAAPEGTVVTVISQHRFDPASVVVREAIAAGRLGRITSAVATVSWWRSQGYYDSGAWRGTWELDGGGALMNQGVHTVDLLLWFLGTPVEVMALTGLLAHERVEVEDTVAAVVRFESGALATLHATTAAYPGLSVRLQVLGDAGSAVIDDDRLGYFHSKELASAEAAGDAGVSADQGDRADQTARVLPAEEPDPAHGPMFTGHARQYRDVVEAIRTGRRPGVTLDDALLALATVRAVYESARTGVPVRVADVLAAVRMPIA
ncbi:Gfo/Idh/MocA family protein [Pseudonocardia adelaidensis]|uniref:Gfo/Idh/MocA family oxidoreductase n=1 Tax=Pseudonocardia adelaidensis TaxID=648754 RepID=A0ABP9NCI1_9PSEU